MGSIFLSKEELAKKDDDHKPTKISSLRAPWSAATRAPLRKTSRRIAIVFALGIFVYLFIHNLPTDVPIRDRRRPEYGPPPVGDKLPAPGPMPKLKPDRKPPRPDGPAPKASPPEPARATAGYDVPLLFQPLSSSLGAVYSSTGGGSVLNKNVLFAAANLKSASMLLPVACQMGAELRSYVHFALMGGSEIDMGELRDVNGIDDSCQVIFHDARPDLAAISTFERLRHSATRALFHIHNNMHPQALLIDASGAEEDHFLAGVKTQAPLFGIPVIELPENAHSRLAWITKLDSSSLRAWDRISVDILIHASPGTSGSLIRLLKSLSAGDFSAGLTPHLTIELPHDVDLATTEYLKTFQWPPGPSHLLSHPRQLTLRHRIPRSTLTEEESSVRFLESFWPADPTYSHVLVLTPQAQLSPRFFHYLKYTVLEYLYSGAARLQEWDSRLLGISLDVPSTLLDASKPFTPPPRKRRPESPEAGDDNHTPFLWQAPNSNAALYTGQKWVELHTLVSELLAFQRATQPVPPFFTEKLVSRRYPAWLEHALKLSRARGYWTLYPSALAAANLATVHNELYRAPEEYEEELAKDYLQDAELSGSPETPFENLLGSGSLLPFNDMPLLLWDGPTTELANLDMAAEDYANDFRRAVGGCEALAPEDLVRKKSMKDLFCTKDD